MCYDIDSREWDNMHDGNYCIECGSPLCQDENCTLAARLDAIDAENRQADLDAAKVSSRSKMPVAFCSECETVMSECRHENPDEFRGAPLH